MMNHPHPIVFLAPGAGLGHLVRCTALALRLRDTGLTSTIVTSAVWARGMARLTSVDTIEIPLARWAHGIHSCLGELRPKLIVCDTFPVGYRGEWLETSPPGNASVCYLARRLKLQPYLAALGLEPDHRLRLPQHTIILEPLSPDHARLVRDSAVEVHELAGRVRLPSERFDIPVPSKLQSLLDTGRAHLIVHSGPPPEIRRLVDRARRERRNNEPIVVISPHPSPLASCPTFDYFPAARLYARALRIYTGAGYNSMAECDGFADAHIPIPFARRYDDQHARVRIPRESGDATAEAAGVIAGWAAGVS